jgi:hypothetical protein
VEREEPKPLRTTLISSTVVSSVCIAMTRAWEEVGRSHVACERRRSASRPRESNRVFVNPGAGPRLDRDEIATEGFDETDDAGRDVWMVTERAAGAVVGRAEPGVRIALGRGVAGVGGISCALAIAEVARWVGARPQRGCRRLRPDFNGPQLYRLSGSSSFSRNLLSCST